MSALSEDLESSLSLLEDVVKHPTFPPDELAKYKEAVKSAIIRQNDNIFRSTSKAFLKTLYKTHPYRMDVLGTLESIKGIESKDVSAMYRKMTVPSNMVFYVFGDIEPDHVLKQIEAKFSTLTGEPVFPPELADDPPPQERREHKGYLDKEQAVVMVGFRAPAMNDPDRYPMEIITTVLGAPLNGRIFFKVRDELGQSYRLGGSFIGGIETGYVYFYVVTTHEQIEKVKEILLQQIAEIVKDGIPEGELSETKTYLQGTHELGLDTNSSLGYVSTLDELFGLGYDNYQRYSQAVEAVTPEDLKRVAAQYFDVNRASVVFTVPPEKTVAPGAEANPSP